MVWRVRELVDAYIKATCAVQYLVVECVVPVVLGADVGQKLREHGHEESKAGRQVFHIRLDPDIADTISRLIIEVDLDTADHPCLFVSELDLFRDVLNRKRWQNFVILRLFLVAFQISCFLNNQVLLSLCQGSIQRL